MLPPPGLAPTLSSLQNATPTILSTMSSILPSPASTASSAFSIATTITSSMSTSMKPVENGQCELLGHFAILVQGLLGLLALMSLVFKRWRERPQRPVKVWFFDVSKQVVGSVLLHIANLLMSMFSSGQFRMASVPAIIAERDLGGLVKRIVSREDSYQPNPCSFYLLNLAIDTTIGIAILIFLLRILTALFAKTPFGRPRESIQSGNYGSPPKAKWWLKQCTIYFIGLLGMKSCVAIFFWLAPWIQHVGDWALRWTEGNEAVQVAFVMFIFPVIMNAMQYYIIDSFIKNQKPDGHERIPDNEQDEEAYADPFTIEDDSPIGDEDDDAEIRGKADTETKTGGKNIGKRGSASGPSPLKTNREYDPLFDGETSPTVVGSASTRDLQSRGGETDEEAKKKADGKPS